MAQEGVQNWQTDNHPHFPKYRHSTLLTTMVEGEAIAVAVVAMVAKMATTMAMGVSAAAAGAVWEVILLFSTPSWPDFLLLSQAKALEDHACPSLSSSLC